MGIQASTSTRRGFTRIELAIVIASITFLGAMGARVLGDNRERSERVLCANNLRQVGRAFHMWASDHGGENPFWTHYRDGGSYFASGTPPPPGNFYTIPGVGAFPAAVRNNAWLQFAFINQELRTPGLLLCPSEQSKLRAQDFSTSTSSNGYLSVNFRDRATSYIVGLHAVNQNPSSILSGDRTLKPDSVGNICVANVGVALGIFAPSRSGWLPGLHDAGGNLLLNDGRVEELSASGLGVFLNPPSPQVEGGRVFHFMAPQ
jgi:hypothetical protein